MKGHKPEITLETSVIVKWFREEDDSEFAILIREWITEDLVEAEVSTIALTELARALMKAKWKKADIYELLELLDDIIRSGGINMIHVDDLIAQNAQRLIVEHNLYSADAIHTSTAIFTDSDYFISADKHHLKKKLVDELGNWDVKAIPLSGISIVKF